MPVICRFYGILIKMYSGPENITRRIFMQFMETGPECLTLILWI